MGALTSSTSLFLVIGLASTNRTPMELRTFVDWTFRPYLLSVPGVAKLDVFGGEIRQLQVQVKPIASRLMGFPWTKCSPLPARPPACGAAAMWRIRTSEL